MKTWRTTIYPTTQRINRQILFIAKKIQFWPSTHIIDAASFIQIASNSGQAEVITRLMGYQTLWTNKNLVRNYSTTKLVKSLRSWASIEVKLLKCIILVAININCWIKPMITMARQNLKSVAYAPMYLQWKSYVVFLLCVAPGCSNLI